MVKAVALDVDGVILKGGKLINGAEQAIRELSIRNIPFIFITNGGGMEEAAKAFELSKKLNTTITADQVLLCHTPFRSLVSKYEKSRILVIGRDECISVAKNYGFQDVVNPGNIFLQKPNMLPVRKTVSPSQSDDGVAISAAFIFHDSVDWTLDMQVLSDILVGFDEKSGKKYQRIPLYACNADIVYATDFPLPRFTQGAFVESFRYLFQMYHKIPLEVTYYGKPFEIQYRFAEQMLTQQAAKLGSPQLITFYGVGDNPKSDIKGANEAGDHWQSILVRTGLFDGEQNDDEHPANHVCESVFEAIHYVINA